MRKLLIAMVLVSCGACVSSRPATVSASNARSADSRVAGGASSPKGAVEAFMTAVKSQDLQGMSAYWGTEQGLAREQMPREELEKRLVVMQCSMAHDAWQYVNSGNHLASTREQEFRVELRQKTLKAETSITTVKGPGDRWFVKNVELQPLNQFCR